MSVLMQSVVSQLAKGAIELYTFSDDIYSADSKKEAMDVLYNKIKNEQRRVRGLPGWCVASRRHN